MNNASPFTGVTLRFIVSGIAATATYLAVTLILMVPPLRLEPVLASALASGVSILVSYAGHHSYTFERKGRHGFYFPRFFIVTAFLFFLSTLGMYFFTRVIPTDPFYVTVAITAGYPIASYLLNLLWVFKLQ
jgi:putative flippase GtrA